MTPAEAYKAALEAAAHMSETMANNHGWNYDLPSVGREIAAAIRALPVPQDDAAKCHDCGRPYGDEHGFPDLVVAHDKWAMISPMKSEDGLLCPSCMCKRAFDAGVTCPAKFTSGPFVALPVPEDAGEAVQAAQWQPIETAPKGGGADSVDDPAWIDPPSILLLFSKGEMCVAYWDWYYAEGGRGCTDGMAWVACAGGELASLYYDAPTHWMPLPGKSVPEDAGDMVMVPKNPSAEMLEAGKKAWKKPRMHVNFQPADELNTCGVIYRAMIEAKE